MAAKSDKERTSKKDASLKASEVKKASAKPKKTIEEDDLDVDEDETKSKAGKRSVSAKSKSEDEDEDDFNDIEEEDNRNKGDADEDWDPDFDEFDLPKSSKKTTPGKKSKDNEDDYKIDDEFKDLFGSKSSSRKYNEDDDY